MKKLKYPDDVKHHLVTTTFRSRDYLGRIRDLSALAKDADPGPNAHMGHGMSHQTQWHWKFPTKEEADTKAAHVKKVFANHGMKAEHLQFYQTHNGVSRPYPTEK